MSKEASSRLIPSHAELYALERHSFSDEVARGIQLRYPDISVTNARTIEQVFDGINTGDACGLVPFENSSAGIVWPNLDRFLNEEWSILAEAKKRICMCVGAAADLQDLAHASRVLSHPKALEQCGMFLSQYPHLQKIATASTVEGIQRVSDEEDHASVALGSESAIRELGLHVLQSDIADLKGDQNVTQFFLAHKNGEEDHVLPEAPFHAAMITPENEVGALRKILEIIERARVDLFSLHSRSIGVKSYTFFAEMHDQGSPSDRRDRFLTMQAELRERLGNNRLKWLGSWHDSFVQ